MELRITARDIIPGDIIKGRTVARSPVERGKALYITLTDPVGRRWSFTYPPGATIAVHRVDLALVD
ncbi:hypothetical protein ACFVZM_06505 [Streptomyces sioyaensis]|uniref:hypothetical protein n=1 Tax=Streptomyces sioyaensis TaxID=67364 RepID=UPI00367DDBC3